MNNFDFAPYSSKDTKHGVFLYRSHPDMEPYPETQSKRYWKFFGFSIVFVCSFLFIAAVAVCVFIFQMNGIERNLVIQREDSSLSASLARVQPSAANASADTKPRTEANLSKASHRSSASPSTHSSSGSIAKGHVAKKLRLANAGPRSKKENQLKRFIIKLGVYDKRSSEILVAQVNQVLREDLQNQVGRCLDIPRPAQYGNSGLLPAFRLAMQKGDGSRYNVLLGCFATAKNAQLALQILSGDALLDIQKVMIYEIKPG